MEDVKLRNSIQKKYAEAGISMVEIERQANKIGVIIHTARPGIVIGRGGQRVDEMRQYLEGLVNKKVQLDIREVRNPELNAFLVARSVADQIERRVAYRRAMKQAIFRTLQAGAKGMRIICSGRLAGAEIARRQMMHQGRVPLQTLRADIDYGFTEAHTTMGRIGVKVWIYRGDILPEISAVESKVAVESTSVAIAGTPASEKVSPEAGSATPAEAVSAVGEAKTEGVVEVKKPRARKKAVETVEETKPAEETRDEVETKPRVRTRKAVPAEEVKKTSKTEEAGDKPKPRSKAVEETGGEARPKTRKKAQDKEQD
jgi:small subunit ribosomal protein S3